MLAVCLQCKLKAKARVYSEVKKNKMLNCSFECVNRDTNKPYLMERRVALAHAIVINFFIYVFIY